MMGTSSTRLLLTFLALIAFACATAAYSQDKTPGAVPSADDMLRQLAPEPEPLTRSYRGIKVERPNDKPPTPPSLDLRINFESGSSNLADDALVVLQNLGRALSDPRLRDSRILIAGHTDDVGFAWFNNRLSKQRAQAVADFLVTRSGIDANRLQVQGFGQSQPLDPAQPTNPLNRRVQIVNLGSSQ